MFQKTSSLLLAAVLIIAVIFSATGCDSSETNSGNRTGDKTAPEKINPIPPAAVEPSPPIIIDASFPDGVPPLNQTRELRCTVRTLDIMPAKNISVSVELPEAFELITGSLSWTGDVPMNSQLDVITAIVKSVKIGNWTIGITDYIDPELHGFSGGSGSFPIYVSISEDSAQWRLNPSYDVRTPGPGEVPVSPNSSDDGPQPFPITP